MMHDPINVR